MIPQPGTLTLKIKKNKRLYGIKAWLLIRLPVDYIAIAKIKVMVTLSLWVGSVSMEFMLFDALAVGRLSNIFFATFRAITLAWYEVDIAVFLGRPLRIKVAYVVEKTQIKWLPSSKFWLLGNWCVGIKTVCCMPEVFVEDTGIGEQSFIPGHYVAYLHDRIWLIILEKYVINTNLPVIQNFTSWICQLTHNRIFSAKIFTKDKVSGISGKNFALAAFWCISKWTFVD